LPDRFLSSAENYRWSPRFRWTKQLAGSIQGKDTGYQSRRRGKLSDISWMQLRIPSIVCDSGGGRSDSSISSNDVLNEDKTDSRLRERRIGFNILTVSKKVSNERRKQSYQFARVFHSKWLSDWNQLFHREMQKQISSQNVVYCYVDDSW
jgi:hypothetical protein